MLTRWLILALTTFLLASPVAAQNILIVPKTGLVTRLDEIRLQVPESTDIRSVVRRFINLEGALFVGGLMQPVLGTTTLPQWSQVKLSLGRSQKGNPIPYRITVSIPREGDELLVPRVTVALKDDGNYALAPTETMIPTTSETTPDGRSNRFASN